MSCTRHPLKRLPKAKIGNWKQLLNSATALLEELKTPAYRDSHGAYNYEAYVKLDRANHRADLDKLVDIATSIQPALSGIPELDTHLADIVGEEWIQTQWDSWIEEQQSYLCDDWIHGINHWVPREWDQLSHQLNQTPRITTGITRIDRLRSKEAKLKKIEQFKHNDLLWLNAFELVDQNSTGFYGRSGGHFCFNRTFSYSELEQAIKDKKDLPTGYDPDTSPLFHDTLAQFREAEHKHNSCKALCQQIETMAKQLDFHQHLRFQLEDQFGTLLTHIPIRGTTEPIKRLIDQFGNTVITIKDSIEAGNCQQGTINWIKNNLPGKKSSTIAQLYLLAKNRCPQAAAVFRLIFNKIKTLHTMEEGHAA